MEIGEQIYYFPLGSSDHVIPSIEMIITVNPGETGMPSRRDINNSGNDR
jgi:hypothetical protein